MFFNSFLSLYFARLWAFCGTFAQRHLRNSEYKVNMADIQQVPKRYGSVIKLKPGMYERYKELHAAVWPKVRIQQCENCRAISSFVYFFKTFFIKISYKLIDKSISDE